MKPRTPHSISLNPLGSISSLSFLSSSNALDSPSSLSSPNSLSSLSSPSSLKDKELLIQTSHLVSDERQLLTTILNHLQEIERRKLFSDLGYQSLFDYAVKELKYSEGQAGRRIQAMRLIKEIPDVEVKIKVGKLSLSNISQAQSYFREKCKVTPQKKMEMKEKLKILENLEGKSAREGQKILIAMQPEMPLPKERERILSEIHTEVRFVMTEDLKTQLAELRSLLGVKGAKLNISELISYMTKISIKELRVKKFGKKRAQAGDNKVKQRQRSEMRPEQGELQQTENNKHYSDVGVAGRQKP